MSLSRSLAFIFLLAFFVTGCAKDFQDADLIGRWVEDKEERRYEFTPNHLYSVVENGTFVQVGVWSMKDGVITFKSLTNDNNETWKPEVEDEDTFTISLGEARFRQFDRVPMKETLFDQRLAGLWRTEGENPEILEFTEKASLVGIFRRLDKVGGTLLPVGCQANVSPAATGEFFLDGYMGDRRLVKGLLPHPYRFETGRLLWGGGRKRPPKVYRKINVQDLGELQQPTVTPTPLAVGTPAT